MKKNEVVFIATMFTTALSGGFVLPLFSLFVEVLGGSFVLVGLVIFGREGTSTFGRIPLGSLSDRWGRKPLLLIGTGGYALSPLIFSFIDRVLYLLPFTILQGVTIACVWPTAFATVSDFSRIGKRGQAIGLFSVITGSGYAIGIVLGGFLSQAFQYVFTYRIAFLVGLFTFLGILIGFKETCPTDRAYVDSLSQRDSLLDQLKLLNTPILLVAALSGLAGSLVIAMGTTFFPLYGVQVGRTEAEIGLILMMTSLMGNGLGIPVGKLADKVDKKTLLFFSILIGLLLVAMIPLMESFFAFFLIFALLSIPDIAIIIIPCVIVADSAEIPNKGLGLGMIQTATHTGKAISPLLFSLLAGAPSLAYTFWGSSVIAGLLLVLLIVISRPVKVS